MKLNPYAAPQSLPEKLPPIFSGGAIVGLIGVGILGGSLLGALTNIINAIIGSQYFIDVMGWREEPLLFLRIVLQGAMEGAVYGAFYGLLFVGLLWLVSQRRCYFSVAVKFALLTLTLVLALWLLGGIAAIVIATTLPDDWRLLLPWNLQAWQESWGYAWAAGSIFASVNGAIIAVIISAYFFTRRHAIRVRTNEETQP